MNLGCKLEIPELVEQVTVITAMVCDRVILLGGDSEVTDDDVRLRVPKLEFFPDRPLAWGFAGDDDTGRAFGAWFKGLECDERLSWTMLRDLATSELNRVNRQRRLGIRQAGATPKAEDVADVLIAGFVDGEPQVLEIDSSGRPTYRLHLGFAAIGSGKNHAKVAHETVRLLAGSPETGTVSCLRAMEVVTKIAAQTAPLCGLPIRMLRITSEGVEELPVR